MRIDLDAANAQLDEADREIARSSSTRFVSRRPRLLLMSLAIEGS